MTDTYRTHRTCHHELESSCFACGLPILPGDSYFRHARYDAKLYAFYTHEICAEAHDTSGHEGWPEGYLIDYLDPAEHPAEWQRWWGDRAKATLTLRAHALGVDCALTDPPAAAKHFAEAALCHAEIDKMLARWAANKETP